ncbi:sialidase family protein [Streptomyces boncukensis]|uniref:exo-alpha-sialidase n=1 Tax=Streptomyces boncukensis TaxID=2711219 RepID=A0A6G4X4B4_9ACTN|nr:sialidase family protein [Streptomyces boncukensis]NGO71511.1 exo-alpha-sialidase [Streptomyces boncukensis]
MPYESSVPFRAGSEGYAAFRIPAVVALPDGTLLAFAEGRADSPADHGNIDIVRRRSADGGRTWGPLEVAAANGDGTAGNPAPVVLDGGRVLLVFVRSAADATEERIRRGLVSPEDGRRVWVVHSDDGGAAWSEPREITREAKRPAWRWYATAPGHALQLAAPAYAGRIVVPANHSTPPALPGDDGTEGRYYGGHDLLSDDGGASWRIGYVDDNPDGWVNVNETTAAELPDGRVHVNARTDAEAPGNRADACSADGGESLVQPFLPRPELVCPVVQGSLLQLRDPDVLLFSAPGHRDSRRRMTLWTGTGRGPDWEPRLTVDERPAAYSDLVRVDGATAGLLYETGDAGAYETITFLRIPVADLVPLQ